MCPGRGLTNALVPWRRGPKHNLEGGGGRHSGRQALGEGGGGGDREMAPTTDLPEGGYRCSACTSHRSVSCAAQEAWGGVEGGGGMGAAKARWTNTSAFLIISVMSSWENL